MVQTGDQAPGFTLPGTAGPLTLGDVWQTGKVAPAFWRWPFCWPF